MTPSKKAELLRAQRSYEFDKDQMKTPDGMAKILTEVKEVFAEIQRQCELVSEPEGLEIQTEIDPERACIMRTGAVGMIVRWEQQYRNVLDNSSLCVEEYNGRLLFQSELGRFMPSRQPQRTRRTEYLPELSSARQYGWRTSGKSGEFWSSISFAEKCVLQFLEAIARKPDDTGFKLRVEWPA
jgi:hypothetical protein